MSSSEKLYRQRIKRPGAARADVSFPAGGTVEPTASIDHAAAAAAPIDDSDDGFDPESDAAAAPASLDADQANRQTVLDYRIDEAQAGTRLDKALAALLPAHSRSRIQGWIDAGRVQVNGALVQRRSELVAGDHVRIEPTRAPALLAFAAEPMPLSIVDIDDTLIVIDKPAGLVMHPGAGNWSGTLANGLLAFDPALAGVARAGIVHRLDADTSGLLVVARTPAAQTDLVRQLQARTVTREYWAIVKGEAPVGGRIDAAIGRDPKNPLRFRVSRAAAARPAATRFRRIATAVVPALHGGSVRAAARASGGTVLSWLACRLETGRTHQIRVHLESIGLPIVGDPVYRRGLPPRGAAPSHWSAFGRQALHACRLGLIHPASGLPRVWFRPPPADMLALMAGLGWTDLASPAAAFDDSAGG